MALTLVVTKSTISSDCGTLTIIDNTGDYDASSNTGGYGSPNETRANLYLKLFLTLKKSDGDEAISIDAYNENTAASWAITITEDGYYEAYLFGCLAWSSGTTFSLNEVTYSSATDKFYYSLQNSNTNNAVTDTDWWAEVTDVSSLKAAIAASQSDAYADVYEWIETCNSRVCKARAYLSKDCGCSDNTGGCECNEKFDQVRYLIDGVDIHSALGTYAKGQTIIETIQGLCNCIEDSDS